MGLGDKFKTLAKQAQDAVAEHKDQIHEAVESVSVAADRKTHGKYTDKIAKFGQKAGETVDKLADSETPGGAPAQSGTSSGAGVPSEPPAGATAPPPAGATAPPPAGATAPPPAGATAPPPPGPGTPPPAAHSAPSFDDD